MSEPVAGYMACWAYVPGRGRCRLRVGHDHGHLCAPSELDTDTVVASRTSAAAKRIAEFIGVPLDQITVDYVSITLTVDQAEDLLMLIPAHLVLADDGYPRRHPAGPLVRCGCSRPTDTHGENGWIP
jgi:hypothetical protein